MTARIYYAASTAACLLLLMSAVASAQNPLGQRVNWIGAAGEEEAWSDPGNWEDYGFGNNVPDGTAPAPSAEYASVSLQGGVGRAVIDSVLSSKPTDIILGQDGGSQGSLIVRNGGSITVAPKGSTGNGELVVGAAGTGNLALEGDMGAVNVARYTQGNNGNLYVRLGGAGDFAQRVVASSGISLDGDISVEQLPESDFTLTTGQSWTVLSGSPVSGGFDSIAVQNELLSNPGQTLAVSTSGNAVTLSVSQRLILSVDQYTGAATLRNEAGHSIDIDMVEYTLESSSAPLNSSNGRWKSFADDPTKPNWLEANPTASMLAEVNGGPRLVFSPGESHDFGTPFEVDASAPMGTARVNGNGISFRYADPDTGQQVTAAIEMVGARNDMALVIDPDSGDAVIQNQYGQGVDFISYTISSPSGSLLPGSFTGIEGGNGPDWYEANWTSDNLSEAIGSLATESLEFLEVLDLGTAWDAASGTRDLTFHYQDPTTGVMVPGVVYYGDTVAAAAGLGGDYNGDGVVDAADYTVWRNHLGESAAVFAAETRDPGNTGAINAADYIYWKSNFGNTASFASLMASSAPVPEPSAWCLVATCSLLFLRKEFRRQWLFA